MRSTSLEPGTTQLTLVPTAGTDDEILYLEYFTCSNMHASLHDNTVSSRDARLLFTDGSCLKIASKSNLHSKAATKASDSHSDTCCNHPATKDSQHLQRWRRSFFFVSIFGIGVIEVDDLCGSCSQEMTQDLAQRYEGPWGMDALIPNLSGLGFFSHLHPSDA